MTTASILFIGSKPMGLAVVAALNRERPGALSGILAWDDRPDVRSNIRDFQKLSEQFQVPFASTSDNTELALQIGRLKPDWVVVCGWYAKIPQETLALVPGGFVALHGSLLPRYRGGSPLVWAMLRGESMAGMTLFHLEPTLDTGDIIGQIPIPIRPEDAIENLLDRAQTAAVSLIEQHLAAILMGTAPCQPQVQSQATTEKLRSPQEGGIDWMQSAQTVHNFIRAQSRPYPGAFFSLAGKGTLRIWKTERITCALLPGQIHRNPDQTVEIGCGQDGLQISDWDWEPEDSRSPDPLATEHHLIDLAQVMEPAP